MVEISTYIRKLELKNPESPQYSSEDFFNVTNSEFMIKNASWFKNKNELTYIPGYLSIKYFETELLGMKYWDYIFWLWSSFCISIETRKIKNSSSFDFNLPDQPINISFEKGNANFFSIRIFENGNLAKEFFIEEAKFIDKVLDAGIVFFEAIQKQSNTDLDKYIRILKAQY